MNSKKKYFEVLNEGNKKATVLINGGISEWGDNSNKRITNEIAVLDQKYDEIEFLINSNGGQVSEGIAIYNAIKSTKAATTGVVVGVAASIAFVILQAFDKRGMRKATRAMSHKFAGGTFGSAKKMREMAELMETWESEVIDEIVERSGQEKETVQGWFKEGEDIWFSPKEMLKNGLIDFIGTEKAVKAPENIANDANALFDHYSNTVVSSLINPPQEDQKNSNSNTVKMKKEHLAMIGLSESASDEVIANKLKELNELAGTADQAKQMIENNAKSIVGEAVKAGKLNKDQEGFAVQLLVEKPKEGAAFLNSLQAAVRPEDLINSKSTSSSSNAKKERKNWTLDDYIENNAVDELSDEEYLELENKQKSVIN